MKDQGEKEGKNPKQRRADHGQNHRIFKAQQKHFVLPQGFVVGKSHKLIRFCPIGHAVPNAAEKRNDVKEDQEAQSRQEEQE